MSEPLGTVQKAPIRARRAPVRTCVACRTSGGKRGLLRVVRLPAVRDADGAEAPADVALDPSGKRSGRGAYVCPTSECVEMALKRRALERSLKAPLGPDLAAALREMVRTADIADVSADSG